MLNPPPRFKVDCSSATPLAVIVENPDACVTDRVPTIPTLPVGPSTVKLPAPTFKSSPINAFLVIAKPPAEYIEAFVSVAEPESVFLLNRTFSVKLVIPSTSRVPSSCELV